MSSFEDIVEDLRSLSPGHLEVAAGFVRRLKLIGEEERQAVFVRTAGALPAEEARELERAIYEGCGGLVGGPRSVGKRPGIMELIFDVRDAEDGGYFARASGYGIFTEGDTWAELRANVMEAVAVHFEGVAGKPELVRLRRGEGGCVPSFIR